MGAIKNSIKIIEKTEHEIDALKAIIDELGLSDEDKACAFGEVAQPYGKQWGFYNFVQCYRNFTENLPGHRTILA